MRHRLPRVRQTRIFRSDWSMRQVFQRSQLGEPYDSMVTRVYDLVLELLMAARKGEVNAARVAAERVAGQAGALEELLTMKKEN